MVSVPCQDHRQPVEADIRAGPAVVITVLPPLPPGASGRWFVELCGRPSTPRTYCLSCLAALPRISRGRLPGSPGL